MNSNWLILGNPSGDWVNPSKRGGMDGVFGGLTGLLRGISQGQTLREIPRSSPASPRKAGHCDSFTWIYILFKIGNLFRYFSEFFKKLCL